MINKNQNVLAGFIAFFLSVVCPTFELLAQTVQINGVWIYPGSYEPDADLSGLDLKGIDFSRVNFPNANFSGSNLEGANFDRAFMPEANFAGANLKDANLYWVSLTKANLSDVNFSEANLNRAALMGANIQNAQLAGANLDNVWGYGVKGIPLSLPIDYKLIKGSLLGPKIRIYNDSFVDLTGADLTGVNLSEAYLSGVDLRGADLEKANLTGAKLYAVDFTEAELSNTIFSDCYLEEPIFKNNNFTGASFDNTIFDPHIHEHLTAYGNGVNFSGTDLSDLNFSGASLWGANLSEVDLSGADLSGANLKEANLSGAKIHDIDFSAADLSGANLANVEGLPAALPDGFRLINGYILGPKVRISPSADLSGGNLEGLNLEDISMPNVDLSGANLTGTKLAGADIGWASPTPKDFESLPIIGEPASLPAHWELRDGYLVDVTSPTLSLIGAQQLTHQFGTEYIDRGATATDNEGFAIEVIVRGAVDGMIAGVYEIEYTATDDSGNISSIIRTITVADTIAPTLSLSGSPEVVHEGGVEYVDSGATAIDNVDGVLDVVVIGQVDFMTVGEYQIQYTATDNSGNIGSVTRIVTVEDNTAPTMQLIEDSRNKVEVGQLYSDPGVIALDSIDGNLSVSVEISGNAEAVSDGEYKSLVVEPFVLIYTTTDKAGNITTIRREVEVTPDVTPPQIELIGDFFNNIYVSHETEMDLWGFHQKLKEWDPGVIVSDKVDSEIKIESSYRDPRLFLGVEEKISDNSDESFEIFYIDVTEPGLYALYYRATDQSNNSAMIYRVVQVREKGDAFYTEDELVTTDFEPPVIALNGPEHVYLELGESYEEQGATAQDAEDETVEVTIVGGKFDTNSLGNYEVKYYAQDRFGHRSSSTRYVNVIHPNARLLTFKTNNKSVSVVDCDESISGDLIIPSSWDGKPVTSFGNEAFYNCESLISLTIPDSVTSIGDYAFTECENLTSVTIPDSVTSIGDYAFYRCERIKSATIGNGVISIGDYAFTWCRRLNSVTIGDSVISIGAQAFSVCRSLRSVTIPDNVTSIGSFAFIDCKNLKSVTIGDSVTSIGEGAFYNCQSLTSVTIPDSVTSIGKVAFRDCIELKNATIGDSVTSIGREAFRDCLQLTSVTIGDSVTSIGDGAFDYCVSLTSVTIPDSVSSIGSGAFRDCWRLTSLTIPDSVTFIGSEAFRDCIPQWTSLPSVTFEGNAPTLGNDVFFGLPRDAKAYIKADATGFDTIFGGLPVVREGSITTATKGNTSDGPIMDAVVFFDVNLNGLPDEGEPQTTSNGWGDYWLDIPLETYDLNDNGVIDISEGVIVSQGGTDTTTGLPVKTTLKGPASATVITPLTTLVTRVMEQNPELDASAAADKLEASLGIPAGVDILNFDTFREASEENPSAADVLTATAKLQDTLVQGGNLIGGATGKSLQEGSDAVMNAIAQQVEAGNNVDLDSKDSLKSLITEAASTSGANLTEAQTDGAASIMEASSKAKEDARAAAGTVSELATEVSRVQAVSQSKAADDLEAVGAQTADLESTVLAYTGAAMQQQVQTEVVGDFNASSYEAPVFNFQSASYTVNENGQQQPVIQINRTGDSFETVELTVTPIASSATAGEDFNGEPLSVSFEPLEIRKTLDLQTLLIDDVLAEEAETFSLQLAVVRDPEDPDLPELPEGEEDPDLSELPEGEEDVFPDRPTVGTLGLTTLTIISDDIANEAPSVSSIEDLEISEGAAQVSVDFSVTDTDSSFEELTLQASTSNSFLISGLIVEGIPSEQDASQWTLNFATVADRFGEGTITVEINDGYQSVSTSFNVTVSAVNNAPQITGVPSVIEAEGRKVVVPFEVSDDQTSAGNLFIYLTAQPLDYILKGHVLVVGNGAQRELILNNSGNAEGTGQFSVVVTDADGKTASQAFEVDFGGEPPVAVVPELKLNTSDPSNLTLSWEGDAQLLFTKDLSAGFEVVAGATSPYTIKQGSMGFFILRVEP